MDQLQDLNFTVLPVMGIEDENIRQPETFITFSKRTNYTKSGITKRRKK
jgi:hypothetical protein